MASTDRILLIDDNQTNLRLMERMLDRAGYQQIRCLSDPRQVLPVFSEFQPDLTILDLHMPHLDGETVLRQLASRSAASYRPILVLTSDASPDARQRALAAGARDFLVRPVDPVELQLRIGNLLETRRLHQKLEVLNSTLQEQVNERLRELERSRLEVLERLALAAEFRDDTTGAHTQRVGRLSEQIARELGLLPSECELIRQAAPLHDMGKIGIPDEILLKPGPLSPKEWEVMKSHTTIGARILSGGTYAQLQIAEEIALTHHEHWDGSGYSPGLKGETIPLCGRIVAVADTFDALTHVRPYKPAWTVEHAVSEIIRLSGTKFDPGIVQAFLRVMERENPPALAGGKGNLRTALRDNPNSLTPREREILDLIAQGLSNQEIAGQLVLGETTVKTHVSHILQKLGVKDRTAAAVFHLQGRGPSESGESGR